MAPGATTHKNTDKEKPLDDCRSRPIGDDDDSDDDSDDHHDEGCSCRTSVPVAKAGVSQGPGRELPKGPDDACPPDSAIGDAERLFPVPPDGGYGWVIMMACFTCNAIVEGVVGSFGVFLPHLLTHFAGGRGKTALAGSVLIGGFLISGPVVSGLINCFGCRRVTMSGGGIACLALILSTLSPNVEVFILLFGAVGGFGVGMLYLPAMVMVGHYFERRRSLATGIAYSGAGIGMLVVAPVCAGLLSMYNWKTALILVSGFPLQGIVVGALMRPLAPQRSGRDMLLDSVSSDEEAPKISGKNLRDSECDPSAPLRKTHSRDNSLEDGVIRTSKKIQSVSLLPENKSSGSCPGVTSVDASSGLPYDDSPIPPSHLNTNKRLSGTQAAVKTQSLSTLSGKTSCNTSQSRLKVLNQGHKAMPNTPLLTESCLDLPSDPSSRTHKLRSHKNVRDRKWLDRPPGEVRFVSYSELSKVPEDTYNQIDLHKLKEEMSKPLSRRDIFYSGSLSTLQEFKAQPDMASYVASVTMIPVDDLSKPVSPGCPCLSRSTVATLLEMVDVALLADPSFLIICVASIFIQVAYFIPIVFIPDFAANLDIGPGKASILLSVIGVANTIGRAGAGCLANIPRVHTLHLNNISLIVCGIATILAALACKSYAALLIYAAVFGLFIAVFVPLTTIFLVRFLGLHRLNNAMGLLSMVRGLSSMMGPPIAGVLLDTYSSYNIVFSFAGAMFVTAGFAFYLLPIYHYWRTARQKADDFEDTSPQYSPDVLT